MLQQTAHGLVLRIQAERKRTGERVPLSDRPVGHRSVLVEMLERMRRPPDPRLRSSAEMPEQLVGVLVQPVRVRHAGGPGVKTQHAVQDRFVQHVVVFQGVIHHADISRRKHLHHLFMPFPQKRRRAAVDRKRARHAIPGDPGLRIAPDIRLPRVQHNLRDASGVFSVLVAAKRLCIFLRLPHADVDFIGRKRRQTLGTVADEKTVAVDPRDVLRFGLLHHQRLVAGQRVVDVLQGEYRHVAQLLQNVLSLGREVVRTDQDGLVHAGFPHGCDEQEDPPEKIDVSGRHDRIVFHAAISEKGSVSG